MSAIFKPIGKVIGGLFGSNMPKAPALLAAPTFNNAEANEAGSQERKRRLNANGRQSTLLSLGDSPVAQLSAPLKNLLGG